MAQNQFILSPDQVISNPGENSSGGFKLTPDQVIPFQPLDGAGGYELSEGDVVDRFSTENPETLFYAMKQNPGRPYSEEQIDTFLEYAVERNFDPSRLADEIVEGIVPMIKDFSGSAVDSVIEAIDADKDFVPTGVSAGPGAMPGYFKDDKDESFAVSAAEGLGRGYTELQALAKSIGFANSISLRDNNRPTSIKDYGMQPKRKKWSSYTPEEKDSARRKFRSLNRALSDQLRYAEGKGTLIGDVALGLSALGTKPVEEMTPEELSDAQDRVEEAYITNDYAQSLVNDRVANFASYFSGEFRLGAKLGKNIAGKGAGSELIEGVSGQVSKGAKAAEEVAEGAAESTAPLAKLPVLDDVDKSVGMAREGLRRIADMAAGLKRNIGKQTDENVFLSISRDTFVDPKNRQLAEWVGHGVFTKYPWISPAMRMMAKPTKTVVAGTKRAIGGAIGGGALTAFTMDEEMMAQGVIGSAMVAFGQGSFDQAAWGRKQDIDAAANRWLLNQSPEIQEAIKERGFTNSEIARWSVFERWAQQLITASTGEADINFVYTDGKNFESVYEYLKSEGLADNINLDSVTPYIEKITKNSAADKLVSETRGVQFLNTRNSGGRPIALVNVSAMSPSTIIHEGIHGLGKLDVLQDYFRPISEYIEKKFSADDLDKFYNDYMRRFDQQTEMRVRGFDKSLADNYAQGTPEADPKYWQHARIKDEIMSDIWEAFLMDKDPLYVTRADLDADASKLAKPMGRLGNLLATFMGATGDPKLLSQNYVDRTGKAIDYGDPQLTSAINGLIKFQQRLRFDDDGKVIRGDIGENESGNTIDLSTLTRDNVPKNLMVAKLDENGNYQFDSRGKLVIEKNQKELRKKENLRKNFSRTVFQDQSYRPDAGFGNKRPMNYDEETGTISGDYIPEEAMKRFRNAPRWLFPQSQLELLEYINESVRKGEPIILDYNARLVPKGKTGAQYSSAVGSSLRTVIPFGFYITKAGNMLMNTVDLGHLSEKYVRIMRDPKRRGAILKQWGVDGDAQATRAAFDKDLIQYMNNIARPDAELGVLKGLGDEATAKRKANVLSAFFGFKKKDIQFRNNAERQRILLEHLNPDRQDNLIRSRRVDAINDIAQSQLEKMPLSTQGRIDIQQNKYEPGDRMGYLKTGEGPVIERVPTPKLNGPDKNVVDLEKIRQEISEDKKQLVIDNTSVEQGKPVGLRLDIPTYQRTIDKGDAVFPISVHEPWKGKLSGRAGTIIGYTNIAAVRDPQFKVNEAAAEAIEGGKAKSTIATVEGYYRHTVKIPDDIGEWTQVAMNPRRHSYFYERATGQPVVSGEMAITTGNTVFVKNPVFGDYSDFRFEPGAKRSDNIPNTNERFDTGLPISQFSTDPKTGGLRFHDGLGRTAREHPLGAAVEVKDLSFYRDPDTALYLADDGLAGTAVTATGDLVSVFKHPQAAASREEMQNILRDASEISTTLDAFDINGFLPNLYAQFGFKPIARVPFNRDYAPKNWPYDLAGEPDVVLMVRDPNNVLPPAPEKYAEARDKYPVFEDYDEAAALQKAAKAQVVDSGLDPYVRFEPPIKKDVAIIDESIPNQRKQHKPAAATKTRAEYSVNQVLFSKIWQKTNQTVDGVKTNDYHYQLDDDGNFKLDKKGKKKPKLSSTRLNSRRGFDMIVSKKPRKAPGAKNITQPEQFYDRLDRAKEFLAGDIGAFLDTTGYVEYMTRAGAYGDLLVPPSGLAPLLNNPKQYVDLVTGGYHEDLTAPGTIDAAMEGLDSTVEMRRVIGDTPPPMITAMHHLWGILSRMLPPVHQEAGWLRLVSNRPVLEAIQSSIDGNYNISKEGWKSIVNRAFKGTASGTGGFGNNSKANANAFHSMLQNLNGKWDQMSDAYHVDKDSTEMGRAFWKLVNENGSMGIKNKVQRFIGLTFGTPGVIMDRWKYVEYNLPMLMNRLQRNGYPASTPKEYFDYGLSGTTPEDPNGIYGTYGAIESGSSSFSLAYYEGIEALINYAIQNSTDLQQLLGRHANVGGMHWVGWNAIKNEAVGHSSLGLTKDIAELVDHKSINPDSVLSIINSGTYFTEGLNGKTRNKVTLDRGEFSHE